MKRVRITVVVFVMLLFPIYAKAKPMMPFDAPVSRLIQNIEQLLQRKPDDYYLHYLAGRLYSLVYATNTQTLLAQEYSYAEKTGKITEYFVPMLRWDSGPNPHETVPLSKKLIRRMYLKKATKEYEKAVSLNPKHGFSFLGLAWCLEESSQPDKALDAYRNAFDILYEVAMKGHFCSGCEDVAAEEAGNAILKLLKNKVQSNKERKEIENKLKEVKKAYVRGWISPVVFPVEPLTESAIRPHIQIFKQQPFIPFDISGLGVTHLVRWLPGTWAFLVWDPENTKSITSGKQLFGSVTWWIFWNDGYEPLSLLDDNHDGWLKGSELEGIAVWRDENQDGVSQLHEVRPLPFYNITGIKTKPDGKIEGMFFSRGGLLLSDGTMLPTLDWIPEVHDEPVPPGI